jgi:hypothetical protein
VILFAKEKMCVQNSMIVIVFEPIDLDSNPTENLEERTDFLKFST